MKQKGLSALFDFLFMTRKAEDTPETRNRQGLEEAETCQSVPQILLKLNVHNKSEDGEIKWRPRSQVKNHMSREPFSMNG